MKTIKHLLYGLVALVLTALAIDCCEHHSDYKVAADDLTIIGSNLVGDVLAVTAAGDTVFVYGKYYSFLYSAPDAEWQTRFEYLEPVGFNTDSVVVKPY